MTIALVVSCAFAHASASQPVLSVCNVLQNRDKYDGKIIILHAYLVLLPESAVLIDDADCDKPGGIRFVADQKISASSEVAVMIRRVASNHMKGRVVVEGLYTKGGFKGDESFLLREAR